MAVATRGQPLGPAPMLGEEGQVARDIAAVGLDRVGGGPLQGGKLRQPLGQRRPKGGREEGGQASQRRVRRSKTPAKKARRSVPCKDLNMWGSSDPKTSIAGIRPLPKSSRITASDRISSAFEP